MTASGGTAETRKQVKALQAQSLELSYIYKPLKVEDAKLYIANVVELLRRCYNSDRSFRGRVGRAWKSEMSYVLATDEATAGNVLATCQQQKMTFLYMVVMDGQEFTEKTWYTLAVVPRWLRDQCGWSACFSSLVTALQAQRLENGFFLGGVFYSLRLAAFLGDYEGLAESFSARGAAALKPCYLCANVLMQRSDVPSRDDRFCSVEESDSTRFVAVEDKDLWALYDKYLLHPPATQAARAERERCCGFSIDASSFLAQRQVRQFVPVRKSLYDVAHCYFANGIVSSEMLLFRACMESKTDYSLEKLTEEITDSNWMRVQHLHSRGESTYWRNKLLWECFWRGKDYKGSATMTMSLFPLFFYCVMKKLKGLATIALEVASLAALAECIVALRELRRASGGPAWEAALQTLDRVQKRHQTLFIAAYKGHTSTKLTNLVMFSQTLCANSKFLNLQPHQALADPSIISDSICLNISVPWADMSMHFLWSLDTSATRATWHNVMLLASAETICLCFFYAACCGKNWKRMEMPKPIHTMTLCCHQYMDQKKYNNYCTPT